MRCKAKMIDGFPVTFEWIDQGKMLNMVPTLGGYERPMGVVHVTQMSGEGFFVQSVVPNHDSDAWRKHRDRAALEQSGVDTATVEYWSEDAGIVRASVPDRFGNSMMKSLPGWLPLFQPTMAESVERITEWNREHGAAPSYPNETLKSWSHAQSKQPIGITSVMEFECPTEIDTYDQKLAKAVKWARDRIGVEKIVGGGIWALDLLAGLAEDFVKTPAPSQEPTHAMIDEGVRAVFVTSFRTGQTSASELAAACWRAMEKARTR